MGSAELSFHHCNGCRFFVCPVCHSGYNQRLWWLFMVCCAVLGTLYVVSFWSICALVAAVRGYSTVKVPSGD
jgi:hypothetical protein